MPDIRPETPKDIAATRSLKLAKRTAFELKC